MDYLYIMGAVIASLLSVVFLYTLRGKRTNVKASKKTQNGELLESSGNGMCLQAKIDASPELLTLSLLVLELLVRHSLILLGR